MSINTTSPECQKFITTLQQELKPFWHEVITSLVANPTAHLRIPLDITTHPLCLISAPDSYHRIINVVPDKDFSAITVAAQTWTKALATTTPLIPLPYPLSEQELDGSIHTSTSVAWHTWLLAAIRHESYRLLLPTKSFNSQPPDPATYRQNCLEITVGQTLSREKIIESLIAAGYIRHQTSLEPGTFRVRGEHIDVTHPALSGHYTIRLFGNTIEQIIHQQNQRSRTLANYLLPPVSFPTQTTVWSAIETDLLFLPVEPAKTTTPTILTAAIANPDLTFPLTAINHSDLAAPTTHTFILFTTAAHHQSYTRSLSADEKERTTVCFNDLAHLPIHLSASDWSLRTETSIFPPQKDITSPISVARAQELIGTLELGRPAVHTDHGIGIYQGLQTKIVSGISREYLLLQYAAGDSLAVPVEFAHKVSPYIGQDNPPIHRLGGTLWQKTKGKAKVDALKFAQELLQTGKKRFAANRQPYNINRTLEQQLDQTFPFDLTSDQERTWQEIMTDLASSKPMDRLIVGDVGFGKTELALRAARHVVENGKQVAVLAPTTLLVQQHFDTFRERLTDIKPNIHLLSRFISTKDQKQSRDAVRTGKAKIAIGTHALLSASTEWHDLGLIIIDEEQRFGVKQKEHFKKLRASVDILSLSATPIPRTLSLSLSGLRDLSIISTAPVGRKSVVTNVKKADDDLLTRAITYELNRGGQVYVVAPKIRHLASLKEQLQALVPQGKFAIAHGRLPDDQLSRIIHDFDAGIINVLISSSIVENGLDLPRANTMIVWQAPHFGLSELYQLRGRVGRRQTQGYSYFLYNQHRLTTVQRQRLAALTEASRLGSGWELARRDLEIRGAGNLLGAEQSGSVNSVGAALYLDMVRQAVDQQENSDNNNAFIEISDCDVQLPFPTIIPTDYIVGDTDRVRWYGRLSRTQNRQELEKFTQELIQTYGPLPEATANLILSLELAHAAAPLKVTIITSQTITPTDEEPYHRLILTTTDPKPALQKLNQLGNWQVRGYDITWDVDKITPDLIERIIAALES